MDGVGVFDVEQADSTERSKQKDRMILRMGGFMIFMYLTQNVPKDGRLDKFFRESLRDGV